MKHLSSRFTEIKFLAHGGMGVVYSAFDKELKRKVAIKLIRREHLKDGGYRKRLIREAKSLCALRHPNIVRVYDFHDSPKLTYLVLEFVEGTTLRELRDTVMLRPKEVVQLMVKLADALAEVHEAKLLHRDIKPENILITNEGKPTFIDFGLTLRDENSEDTRMTETGCIVGTVGYLAPELLFGAEHTNKCDIYQLGVVFYELLTNKEFVDSEKFNEMLRGNEIKVLPPSRLSDADKELDAIVLAAVEFNADERTDSAQKLRDQCLSWLKIHEKEDSRPFGTLVTSSVRVSLPRTKLVQPKQSNKLAHLACVVVVLFLLLVSASHLFTKKPRATLVDFGADWVTFTLVEANQFKLTTAAEKKVVQVGRERAGKKIKVGPLESEKEYQILLGDNAEVALSFKTKKLHLKSAVRVFALGDSLFLSARTNLQKGRLEVLAGSGKKRAFWEANKEHVIVRKVERYTNGAIPWSLSYGDKEVASGHTFRAGDFALQGKLSADEPNYYFCWHKENIFLGDRKWKLSQATIAPHNPKNKDDLLLMQKQWPLQAEDLRNFRWLVNLNSQQLFYGGLESYEKDLRAFVLDLPTGNTRAFTAELSVPQRIVHAPCIRDDKLFFQGLTLAEARWTLLHAKTGEVLSEKKGKTSSISIKHKKGELYINFSSNRGFPRGFGFLCPPFYWVKRYFSLYGERESMRSNWMKAQLLSMSIEEGNELSPIVNHGTYRTWVGTQTVSRINNGKTLTFAGKDEIYAYDSKKSSLTEFVRIGKHKGHFASPAVELKGRYYAIISQRSKNIVSGLDQVIHYHSMYLATWQADGALQLKEPPLFKGRSSMKQLPGIRFLQIWNDRYLVGTSYLTLFAIDLRNGDYGSVYYAGEVIKQVAMNEEGIVCVLLQGERLSVLPVPLIVEANKRRLQN